MLVSKVLSFARQVEHQRQKQRKTAAAVATLPSPSKRTLSRDNSAIERAQAIDPYADSVTRRFFMDVLAGLLFSLESKSKGFKKGFVVDKSSGKTVLACIFLLNNFHYVRSYVAWSACTAYHHALYIHSHFSTDIDRYSKPFAPLLYSWQSSAAQPKPKWSSACAKRWTHTCRAGTRFLHR